MKKSIGVLLTSQYLSGHEPTGARSEGLRQASDPCRSTASLRGGQVSENLVVEEHR